MCIVLLIVRCFCQGLPVLLGRRDGDTLSFGKMKGDASDKNIACMLQDDKAGQVSHIDGARVMLQYVAVLFGGHERRFLGVALAFGTRFGGVPLLMSFPVKLLRSPKSS